MLSQFVTVLLQVLIHRSHNLLQEEIGVTVYNMAAVDFVGFYEKFIPQFLAVTEYLDDQHKSLLLQIFNQERVSVLLF